MLKKSIIFLWLVGGLLLMPSQSYAYDLCAQADLTADKKVNIFDYTVLASSFFNSEALEADINQDDVVNIIDYTELVKAFQATCVFEQPCAQVTNESGVVFKNFCQDGTHPIKDALSYANKQGFAQVVLDPGTFVISEKTTGALPHPVPVALQVPNNVKLIGSSDSSQPTTIQWGGGASEVDALLYLGADRGDAAVPLTALTISDLTLEGETSSGEKIPVAVWAGKSQGGVSIQNIKVQNFNLTGMILGIFASAVDSGDGQTGTRYAFDGLPGAPNIIENNTITNVGGDAIGVVGSYSVIRNNHVSEAQTQNLSNGVTLFIDAHDSEIYNNTFENCFTGVGLDGSYPLFQGSLDITEFQAQLGEAGKGNELGFNYNINVHDNTVTNCEYGISLWRTRNSTINNNVISQTEVGIMLNESRDNVVTNNTIQGGTRGVVLRGLEHSLVGTKNNTVGLASKSDSGNTIESSGYGLDFEGNASFTTENQFYFNAFSGGGCNFVTGTQSVAQNNSPSNCNL